MLSRGRLLFISISLVSVALLVSGTMLASAQQDKEVNDSPYKYLAVFMEVFGLVGKAYVDEPNVEELMDGAFEGVFDALDPFSVYVPADSMELYRKSAAVGTSHSGLVVLKERGVAYAMAVEDGSPGAEAGLERGDIIATIDGTETRTMPLFEIQSLLAGEPGTLLNVERLRQGGKEIVEIALADYEPPAVELSAREGVPVLRLPSIHDGVTSSVRQSLETIPLAITASASGSADAESDQEANPDQPANDNQPSEASAESGIELPKVRESEKLILDLRGVAGGDAETAYRVAGLFTGGELGALRRRERDLEVFEVAEEQASFKGQLVVLVDRSTQGAAEILVTVLRQQLEAAVIGESTFGHSGVLEEVELSGGGTLMITSAFFTGPDREPIAEKIEPDVWVRGQPGVDEDGKVVDIVLDRGVKFLLEGEEVEQEAAA